MIAAAVDRRGWGEGIFCPFFARRHNSDGQSGLRGRPLSLRHAQALTDEVGAKTDRNRMLIGGPLLFLAFIPTHSLRSEASFPGVFRISRTPLIICGQEICYTTNTTSCWQRRPWEMFYKLMRPLKILLLLLRMHNIVMGAIMGK